jgi:hypothetical protein
VPALIWWLNIVVFHGSNYSTAVLALIFLLSVFMLLYRHFTEVLHQRAPEHALMTAVVAVLVFRPSVAHDLAMSFCGVHFYLSDLLAILSMIVLISHRPTSRFGPWPVAILGLAGVFTFSSNLAVWPALAVGAVVLGRRPRDFAVLAVAAAGACAAFLVGLDGLPGSEAGWPAPGLLLRHLGVFVGSLFTSDVGVARYLGWGALALSAILQLLVIFRVPRMRSASAFWLMIQTYAVGNGVLAGLGRLVKFGERQAMATRYSHFPALFWAGMIVLVVLLWRAETRRSRLSMIVFLAVALFVTAVLVHCTGFDVMTEFARRGARQQVTELALLWSSPDDDLIRRTIGANPVIVRRNLELFESLEHVPFDREVPEVPDERFPLEVLSAEPHPDIDGSFSQVRASSNPDLVRVLGWAHHPRDRVAEVIFVDQDRRQTGRIIVGLHRNELEKRLGRRAARTAGWEGFVWWRRQREDWIPYARLESDRIFYPLSRDLRATRELGTFLEEHGVRAPPPAGQQLQGAVGADARGVPGDVGALDNLYFVPGVARARGSKGSFYLTDVEVRNADDATAGCRYLWLPRGTDNSRPTASVVFSVGPGEVLRHTDVLGVAFGVTDGTDARGAVALVSDSESLELHARIYNRAGTGGLGQDLPGIASRDLIQANVKKRISSFAHDRGYRSNFAILNGTDSPIAVRWNRCLEDGSLVESGSTELPPWGNVQRNRVFAREKPVAGGYIDVWTETEGASFTAYGSLIDKRTSQPTTLLPQDPPSANAPQESSPNREG